MNTINLIPFVYERFSTFILVFARISALFTTFVLFRQDMVNSRVIIGLSALLSVLVLVFITNSKVNLEVFSLNMFVLMIFQAFVGFMAGLILNVVFEVFSAVGQVVSMQVGLGLAAVFDPRLGSITTLTQFYFLSVMMIFLLLNGHLFVINTLVESFTIVPIGHVSFPTELLSSILSYSSLIFSGAIMLSITIVIAILATNFALALMSKFAPQFNLFSIGINLALVIGLICVYLTYGLLINDGSTLINNGLRFMMHAIRELR